jgi:hypothetical protein
VLKPAGISPDSAGTVALVAEVPYGETGLILAFIGILFAVGGAHGVLGRVQPGQHQGWKWGKRFRLLNEPRFTLSLAGFLLLGFAIAQTGVDPISLTEYAVIFSIPVLPLTYLPILLVGNDRAVMGKHVNGPSRACPGGAISASSACWRSRPRCCSSGPTAAASGELRSLSPGSAARRRPSAFAPLAEPPGGDGARAG